MILDKIAVTQLRNLKNINFQPVNGINAFIGDNGSGKTSLLEAIYLLNVAKSFRSNTKNPLIQHGEETLVVYGVFSDGTSVGVKKARFDGSIIKINQEKCYSIAELAALSPMLLIYQDVFQIMDAGSELRRGFLDWGLFHVEPRFFPVWQRYKKALKQRNKLLKNKVKLAELEPWNTILAEAAEKIDDFRRAYCMQLFPVFYDILTLLSDVELDLSYYSGWYSSQFIDLKVVLIETHETDSKLFYTTKGAHRADIVMRVHDRKAKTILSRGQQKIVLCALKLAQATLLNKECIYLFDDISSELDLITKNKLACYLQSINGQLFISGVDTTSIAPFIEQAKLFSLEKGVLSEISSEVAV